MDSSTCRHRFRRSHHGRCGPPPLGPLIDFLWWLHTGGKGRLCAGWLQFAKQPDKTGQAKNQCAEFFRFAALQSKVA